MYEMSLEFISLLLKESQTMAHRRSYKKQMSKSIGKGCQIMEAGFVSENVYDVCIS